MSNWQILIEVLLSLAALFFVHSGWRTGKDMHYLHALVAAMLAALGMAVFDWPLAHSIVGWLTR